MTKFVIVDSDKLAAIIEEAKNTAKNENEVAAIKESKKENISGREQSYQMNRAERKAIETGEAFINDAVDIIFGEKLPTNVIKLCEDYMSSVVGQASIEGLISMLQTFADMSMLAAKNNAQTLTGLLCCPPGNLQSTMQSEPVKTAYSRAFSTMILSMLLMTTAGDMVGNKVKELMGNE